MHKFVNFNLSTEPCLPTVMNSRICVFLGTIFFEIASHECAASKIFISYLQEVFYVLSVMCPDIGIARGQVSYSNLRYVDSVATIKSWIQTYRTPDTLLQLKWILEPTNTKM